MMKHFYLIWQQRNGEIHMELKVFDSPDGSRPDEITPPSGWMWRCWTDELHTEKDLASKVNFLKPIEEIG